MLISLLSELLASFIGIIFIRSVFFKFSVFVVIGLCFLAGGCDLDLCRAPNFTSFLLLVNLLLVLLGILLDIGLELRL